MWKLIPEQSGPKNHLMKRRLFCSNVNLEVRRVNEMFTDNVKKIMCV